VAMTISTRTDDIRALAGPCSVMRSAALVESYPHLSDSETL